VEIFGCKTGTEGAKGVGAVNRLGMTEFGAVALNLSHAFSDLDPEPGGNASAVWEEHSLL
jgi:hypothetical protein